MRKYYPIFILFLIPLVLWGQNPKDTELVLADSLQFYGLEAQKKSAPEDFLGFRFREYNVIWKDDDNIENPFFAYPGKGGNPFYLKHSDTPVEYVAIQIGVNSLLLREEIYLIGYPEMKNRTTISQLIKDVLHQLVEVKNDDSSSIYLSILSKPDLQELGLYNEIEMSSYYLYAIWNNSDGYELPIAFKKATHKRLYGEEREIRYAEAEKEPVVVSETEPEKTVAEKSPAEKGGTGAKTKKTGKELPNEVTPSPSPPGNLPNNSVEQTSESDSSPPISAAQTNHARATAIFDINLRGIQGFSHWETNESNQIAFHDCSFPLSERQNLLDIPKLKFSVTLTLNEGLSNFTELNNEHRMKKPAPPPANGGKKHPKEQQIKKKLEKLFATVPGLEEPHFEMSISEDEKYLFLPLVEGKINGLPCQFRLQPKKIPIKYTDFFITAQFDESAKFQNLSVNKSDLISQLSFKTQTGIPFTRESLPETIRMAPLVHGFNGGIRINDNHTEDPLTITSYSVKDNFLNISYSADQHASVIIIYPHFFRNKRTLVREIDKQIKSTRERNGKFMIYVASEFNPQIFTSEHDDELIRKTLAQMYGNLVPSFNNDLLNVAKDKNLTELQNLEYLVSMDYSFFVPAVFWKEFEKNFLSETEINNGGNFLIPKDILQRSLPSVSIKLFFPRNSNHIESKDFFNQECQIHEI